MADKTAFEQMAEEAQQAPVAAPPEDPGQNISSPVPLPAAQPIAASTAPVVKSDSLAQDYQNHKQAIDTQAAFEQMQQEAKQGAEPLSEPAKPGEPPPAATNPARQSMVYDADKHLYVPDPNVHLDQGASLADVGKDVGKGAIETPRAIYSGVTNAIRSTYDAVDDFSTWIADKLKDATGYQSPGKGAAVLASVRSTIDTAGKLPEPETVTGKLVENTAQFITSMNLVSKALGGLQMASTVKGALALFVGFDGHSQNLSNLIQGTSLANPVNEFLASKPDDNEALGRLKNAVQGTGLGKLAEGFVGAVRMLKAGGAAQSALESLPEDASLKPPEGDQLPAERPLANLGDASAPADAPLVSMQAAKQKAAEQATGGIQAGEAIKAAEPATSEELAGPKVPGATEAQAKEPVFHVNFARIDGPDDVKRALSEMAGAQAQNVDAARRGIQTFEQTQLGAASKDAFQILMDRRVGQPLNDQEMLAARQLEYQSASATTDAIYAAVDNPTPENLLAYRKMMTTHAMISAQVRGAQAEVARSLSAFRIPVGEGDPVKRMGAVMQQINDNGGVQANMEHLYKIKSLVDAWDIDALNNVAEKSLYARTRDGLLNAWTNGLISNPMTHIKVALSNASTVALRLTETRIAESLDKLLGSTNGVVAGETAQTTAGLIQSIKDAFRYVGKSAGLNIQAPDSNAITDAMTAFKSGQYSVGEPTDKWGTTLESQLATGTTQMSDSGWVGQGMDLLGQAVRLPGRALTAEHEFFRSIGMRMELNRFAIRQATQELNAGKIEESAFQGRVASLIENPPRGLTENAVGGMTYQTFTDAPGNLADLIQNLREAYPLTKFIIPFYKIPSRILSFTFERSPLAPLMSSFRQNISAGGARQSMALAQMGLGSSVMLATADAVLNGQVTGAGPKEKGQRLAMENEGWLPYSVKVGDHWVQYNRLETIGSSMSMAADAVESIRDYHTAVNASDDPDVMNLAAALSLALANDVTSKSYLEGIARLFEAMGNPKEGAKSALLGFAGSAVPAIVGAVDKAVDPYQRAVNSMSDALKARTPGMSQDLPPMRNVWGEPVSHQSGLGKAYDAFVPFATRQSAGEPIDQELLRLGMNVNLPPSRTTINSAKVDLKADPEMYSRYVQLAGNEVKDPLTQMGTKDTLNALVTGSHPLSSIYNLRQDEGKQTMIEDIVNRQRTAAKQQLLKEYQELASQVSDTREKQQSLKGLSIQ